MHVFHLLLLVLVLLLVQSQMSLLLLHICSSLVIQLEREIIPTLLARLNRGLEPNVNCLPVFIVLNFSHFMSLFKKNQVCSNEGSQPSAKGDNIEVLVVQI